MRRRTLYLPVMIAAAVLMACAAVLAVSERAEATFPGKNGRIAYSAFDFDGGVDETISTMKAGGPEPFPGEPFVFKVDVPVHAVSVVEVNQEATAKGVTLRLDRVINSPGRPRAVICYEPPDDKHVWFMYGGGSGVFQDGWSTSGWAGTGSMRGVPPGKCQKLMLEAPMEGRTSVEVKRLEGEPDCPYNNAKAFEACYEEIGYRTIRGSWKFEFEVPNPAGGDRPAREADD